MRIDVWWASAEVDDESHPLLSPRERTRVASIASLPARTESMSAAVLLRSAVAERVRLPPGEIRVERSCPHCSRWHGRPGLPDFPGLDVSVTHAGGVVGVAVADSGIRVGIDLERVADAPEQLDPSLLDLVAHRDERADLLAPGDSRRRFSTMWVRKEAATKLLGSGVRATFSEIDARRSPVLHEPKIWVRALLPDDDRFVAALATDSDVDAAAVSEHPWKLAPYGRTERT